MSPYVIPGLKNTMFLIQDARVRVEIIIKEVVVYTGCTEGEMVSQSRSRRITYARFLCMFCIRNYTNLSLKAIGERFGKRDHTSVIHALASIKDMNDVYASTRNDLDNLRKLLF